MMHLVLATEQRGQSSHAVHNSRFLAVTTGLAADAQLAANAAKLGSEAVADYYKRANDGEFSPNSALTLAHWRLREQNGEARPALQASSVVVQFNQNYVQAAGWGNCTAYLYRLDCRYLYALALNDVDRDSPATVIAQRRPSRKRQSHLDGTSPRPQRVLGAVDQNEIEARIVTHRCAPGDLIILLSAGLACGLGCGSIKNTILTVDDPKEIARELLGNSKEEVVIVAQIQV